MFYQLSVCASFSFNVIVIEIVNYACNVIVIFIVIVDFMLYQFVCTSQMSSSGTPNESTPTPTSSTPTPNSFSIKAAVRGKIDLV